MKEWIAEHFAAIVAGLGAVIVWFVKRDVKRAETTLAAHGARLTNHGDRIITLETDRITRDDFEAFRQSFGDDFSELRKSMVVTFAEGVRQVQEQLLELKVSNRAERQEMHLENRESANKISNDLARVHKRVDDLWEQRRP